MSFLLPSFSVTVMGTSSVDGAIAPDEVVDDDPSLPARSRANEGTPYSAGSPFTLFLVLNTAFLFPFGSVGSKSSAAIAHGCMCGGGGGRDMGRGGGSIAELADAKVALAGWRGSLGAMQERGISSEDGGVGPTGVVAERGNGGPAADEDANDASDGWGVRAGTGT